MTIGEALRESKARFEAGERELAGPGAFPKSVAPSYSRSATHSGYIRWDPEWSYSFEADDMVADDWSRNS